MGTSYVNIGQAGFWMRDAVLELWLRLLALHLPEPGVNDTTKQAELARTIRDAWLFTSRGWCNGCVDPDLERFARTDSGKSIILAAMDSLRKRLRKAPDQLNKDVLNLLGWDGIEYMHDFETQRLLQVESAFRDLIEGRITDTIQPTEFMPGSVRIKEEG